MQGMSCATRLQHVPTDEVKQGIIYTEASLLAMDFAALDLSTFVHSAVLMLSTLVVIVHVLPCLHSVCLMSQFHEALQWWDQHFLHLLLRGQMPAA